MQEYRNFQAERRKAKKRKKSIIKNWIILIQFILILILVISLLAVSLKFSSLKKSLSSDTSSVNSQTSSVNNSSIDANLNNQSIKDELNQWYMKLVNPDNAVSNDFIRNVDLAEIDTRFVQSVDKQSCIYFDKRAVEHLESMCEAALQEGIKLTVISSYRDYSYQQGLFNNKINRLVNSGYNRTEAKKVAATVVAEPGTSEHHLGLAVDFNSVEESFDTTNAYKWLIKNCTDYGFILRYPKDKVDITKIIYEPWHYRYVGVEHAKEIERLGFCFEEYIDYLNNGAK